MGIFDGLKEKASIEKEFQLWQREVTVLAQSSLTRNQKRKKMAKLLSHLSQKAYQPNIKRIMNSVQKSKVNCEPFKNTAEQVMDIFCWLPRLRDNKETVTQIIQERRKKYKLEV